MRVHRYGLFALCICCAFSTAVWAQAKDEKKPADKPAGNKAAPGGEDMAKMMEVWQKAATPGEFHAKLKPLAGNWNFVTKFRMSPDEPWGESTGKAEYEWILGDRVLLHEVKGTMMGGPFEGFGMTGYDNVTKKYWNVWTDSMGTSAMMSTGSVDGSGKTFTYSGAYDDPIFGHKTVKSVLKIAGDDKLVFEMYDKGPDGKEFMTLEVTYTRQK